VREIESSRRARFHRKGMDFVTGQVSKLIPHHNQNQA
jgi:hypothetical protein